MSINLCFRLILDLQLRYKLYLSLRVQPLPQHPIEGEEREWGEREWKSREGGLRFFNYTNGAFTLANLQTD